MKRLTMLAATALATLAVANKANADPLPPWFNKYTESGHLWTWYRDYLQVVLGPWLSIHRLSASAQPTTDEWVNHHLLMFAGLFAGGTTTSFKGRALSEQRPTWLCADSLTSSLQER